MTDHYKLLEVLLFTSQRKVENVPQCRVQHLLIFSYFNKVLHTQVTP